MFYFTINLTDSVDETMLRDMQWTDNLDPIFNSNYEMDPVLSWQYFGSTKGTLRRFPSKYNVTQRSD